MRPLKVIRLDAPDGFPLQDRKLKRGKAKRHRPPLEYEEKLQKKNIITRYVK